MRSPVERALSNFESQVDFTPPARFERRVERGRTIRYEADWIGAWLRAIAAHLEGRLGLGPESLTVVGPHEALVPADPAPLRIGYSVSAHRKLTTGSDKGAKVLLVTSVVFRDETPIAWSGDLRGGASLYAIHRVHGAPAPMPSGVEKIIHRP